MGEREEEEDHSSLSTSDASTASLQVEELKEFARDPIILADDVSPLDGFQFLTGVCSIGRLLRS